MARKRGLARRAAGEAGMEIAAVERVARAARIDDGKPDGRSDDGPLHQTAFRAQFPHPLPPVAGAPPSGRIQSIVRLAHLPLHGPGGQATFAARNDTADPWARGPGAG